MTIHNKLIRDKILEMLDQKGIAHTEHIADEKEYEEKLFAKLVEEAKELEADGSLEELADVLEVVEAIKVLKGYTADQVEAVRLKKKDERGGFEKGIILEES